MQKVYVIKYVSYYKYGDPNDPIIEIYDDLYFKDYKTALNYAKNNNIENFDIDTLNLYIDIDI